MRTFVVSFVMLAFADFIDPAKDWFDIISGIPFVISLVVGIILAISQDINELSK